MLLTAGDLLRLGLTVLLAVLAYGRLGTVLRFLFPFRVRHRARPGLPEPEGPAAAGLRRAGFRFLGVRQEDIFRMHGRVAAVFAHPDGRVADLPLSGRLPGAYLITLYDDGRCALTRVGAGRDVVVDRYRSTAMSVSAAVPDLLLRHAESQSALSLGRAPIVAATLEDRLGQAATWYREHARSELIVPALLEGVLFAALLGFSVYLWLV
jgi:hypothetical protein